MIRWWFHVASSFCWICLEFICLFGRNIHFSLCLVFDFRWFEKEIGSDIVGFMKTDSVQMHGSRCW